MQDLSAVTNTVIVLSASIMIGTLPLLIALVKIAAALGRRP